VSEPHRPEDLLGQPVPDLVLPGSDGRDHALRERLGKSQLVLFFYIKNGTPG